MDNLSLASPPQREKLIFHEDTERLIKIHLLNVLKTVITLGIYSFWARVNITRFIYEHTEFQGERFSWHATGWERFRGFLIGGTIFFGYIFGIQYLSMWAMDLQTQDPEKAAELFWLPFLAPLINLVVIMIAIPFIIVGSLRYRLSRSSYRNIRFLFTGTVKEFMVLNLKGTFLTILSAGFYYPLFIYDIMEFRINHFQYGNTPLHFSGDRKTFYLIMLKGIFLQILTLGIYGFWFFAEIERYTWNNTKIQGKPFGCTLTGGKWMKASLIYFATLLFTGGLLAPVGFIYLIKARLDNMQLPNDISMDEVTGEADSKASPIADGISEAAEGIGSIFG